MRTRYADVCVYVRRRVFACKRMCLIILFCEFCVCTRKNVSLLSFVLIRKICFRTSVAAIHVNEKPILLATPAAKSLAPSLY